MDEDKQLPEVAIYNPKKCLKQNELPNNDLRYRINDIPPWYTCIGFGIQFLISLVVFCIVFVSFVVAAPLILFHLIRHYIKPTSYLMMLGGVLMVPLFVVATLCISGDDTAKGEIIGTNFFVSGLVTVLQSTFGSRLPIVQGGSAAFFAPIFAILSLPEYSCKTDLSGVTRNETLLNGTDSLGDPMTWQGRMLVLQGCLTMAALLEVFIGLFGVVGFLMRYIGPITVAPTIILIGMSLADLTAKLCAAHWWIALLTTFLLMLFSQYLANVNLPSVKCLQGKEQQPSKQTNFFQPFAFVLAAVIALIVCAVLTVTDVLPATPGSWGYEARIDTRLDSISQASWFRLPYPGQFGWMTFNASGIAGMTLAVLASILESIGDYYACAKICGAPPPPIHAINRGIFVEGIGCVMCGLWGTGVGITSHSNNIAAIGLTRIGSRRIVQVGACIVVFMGIFGKIGAVFSIIPTPVIGGLMLGLVGMMCSVGVSNLQTADMNSTRNMFIFGLALFTGIVIPPWVSAHASTIDLGNATLSQTVSTLLRTSMTVGGLVAFILDNTIPGTLKERGMLCHDEHTKSHESNVNETHPCEENTVYDLPIGMSFISENKYLRYLPISPSYGRNHGKNSDLTTIRCSNGSTARCSNYQMVWQNDDNNGKVTEC